MSRLVVPGVATIASLQCHENLRLAPELTDRADINPKDPPGFRNWRMAKLPGVEVGEFQHLN